LSDLQLLSGALKGSDRMIKRPVAGFAIATWCLKKIMYRVENISDKTPELPGFFAIDSTSRGRVYQHPSYFFKP